MTHEDNRRVLVDVENPEGGRIKIVIAKKDCILGKHYHKIKTEIFTLSHGEADVRYRDINKKRFKTAKLLPGNTIVITPDTLHEFFIRKGSVLLCHVDRDYDPSDDYHE